MKNSMHVKLILTIKKIDNFMIILVLNTYDHNATLCRTFYHKIRSIILPHSQNQSGLSFCHLGFKSTPVVSTESLKSHF